MCSLFGQDLSHEDEHHEHQKMQRHILSVFTGYTLIPKAVSDEGKGVIIVPSLGLDYEYRFSHKFMLGWQNDIELSSYVVEDKEGSSLKRDYAFISAVVAIYEPFPWWSLFAGPGYEFEHHESFFVGRIGTDFAKNFEDGWAVAITLVLDFKEVNTSAGIGISVKKSLGKLK